MNLSPERSAATLRPVVAGIDRLSGTINGSPTNNGSQLINNPFGSQIKLNDSIVKGESSVKNYEDVVVKPILSNKLSTNLNHLASQMSLGQPENLQKVQNINKNIKL